MEADFWVTKRGLLMGLPGTKASLHLLTLALFSTIDPDSDFPLARGAGDDHITSTEITSI